VMEIRRGQIPLCRGSGATIEEALAAAGVGEIPVGPPKQLSARAWFAKAIGSCHHNITHSFGACPICIEEQIQKAIDTQVAVDQHGIRQALTGSPETAEALIAIIWKPEAISAPVDTDMDAPIAREDAPGADAPEV
jgi:hypothetical protein